MDPLIQKEIESLKHDAMLLKALVLGFIGILCVVALFVWH